MVVISDPRALQPDRFHVDELSRTDVRFYGCQLGLGGQCGSDAAVIRLVNSFVQGYSRSKIGQRRVKQTNPVTPPGSPCERAPPNGTEIVFFFCT
jgi:hypothetical protein